MAIRVEKAFGVSMETLMRMQNSFAIAQAHKREAEIAVGRYVPNAGTSEQSKPLLAPNRDRPADHGRDHASGEAIASLSAGTDQADPRLVAVRRLWRRPSAAPTRQRSANMVRRLRTIPRVLPA